jgi:RNA polymerase sigma factor (sigma-70 family)
MGDVALSFEDEAEELFAAAYRSAFRVLGSRASAEDAAAEAVARAFVRWKRIAPYGRAWAAKVSFRLALKEQAHQRRTPPSPPVTTVDIEQLRVDIVRALRRISRRQREAVVLRYFLDLPEAQVAEAMRCSIGSVKQHAARGLAALTNLLKE